MSFKHTVKEALGDLNNLKRIRLKVDPKDAHLADFTQFNGYEGYIIEENDDDTIDVFITSDDTSEMQDGLITTIPVDCVDIPGSLTVLEKFKLALVTYFKSRHMMPTEMLQELVLAKTVKECRCCLDQLDSEGFEIVLTSFLNLLEDCE